MVLNLPVPQNVNSSAGLAVVTFSIGTLLHRLISSLRILTYLTTCYFLDYSSDDGDGKVRGCVCTKNLPWVYQM
jgi:hypothetical protein